MNPSERQPLAGRDPQGGPVEPGEPGRPAAGSELDLAFEIGTDEGDPLDPGLAPLLAEAGALTGDAAEDIWRTLLSQWLAALETELPPALRSGSWSLGLLISDDASIARLNGQWRQRPEATDVLAFAALDAVDDAPPPPAPADWEEIGAEPLELGDIVISLETAARQAEEQGHSLDRELLFLASHGLLHLLGWDHPDEASLAAMLARQERLIAELPAGASG